MRNKISAFEISIDKVNVLYGLQLPVGISTMIAILIWIFDPSYFQAGSLRVYIPMILIVTIVSAIHAKRSANLTRKQIKLIYATYHAAMFIFTAFVAPFLSPFDFLWIALAIGSDLMLRRNVKLITFSTYALALLIAYMGTSQTLTLDTFFRILVQYLGVIFIALQVSKYRVISDQERTALDSTSRESSFERQRLLSLINNMGEAVVATDKDGKILIYNAAVLSLLDTNQTLEGKSLDRVLHLRDGKNHKIRLSSLLEKSPLGLTTTDYRHEFAPNDIINMYINIAPVKLGFREAMGGGFIMLMRDITKEKSLEDERDEFISVVSHELRTPIAIAEGNLSNAIFVSNKSKVNKLIASSLEQAHNQVMFLASMINDLATLSRAERTDTPLEITTIDPAAFLATIGNDYRKEADVKKLTLTVTAARDTAKINTSELYLHEILQNFITNSLKYTKKGGVLLHVRSNKAGDAVFSVADTGIGLTKSDQKRVFDKFFRSEDYRTRESSGTGLGLYVTAKLAHRLNAQITLESELNKGSTFTITVPSMRLEKKHAKPLVKMIKNIKQS